MNELTETRMYDKSNGDTENNSADNTIVIRRPRPEDGQKIWAMVKKSGNLDLNSVYCYLLLCDQFRNTCLVAEDNGETTGFITAYIHPENEKILFIWQICVAENYRGRGMAKRLILELMNQEKCSCINKIQATVSPSNMSSRSLFKSLAKELDAVLTEQEYFGSSLFSGNKHEKENLITVGPFNR